MRGIQHKCAELLAKLKTTKAVEITSDDTVATDEARRPVFDGRSAWVYDKFGRRWHCVVRRASPKPCLWADQH